ncbi:hypothetical protein DUNSADRAFT_6672 [Dunaliella salina]|uniref:RRM domain-containing protein n=1 Tax=Dunaliella salina TaxID=3046 RepID=A0ABQ7GMT4_DUNSA|nr:hypothetical protein DUNSADRAFT_6672 [Dunaliella salina]KAF5835915.1 hypothetical protein DUNSADRAFT_6672 [Dunaliella salina]|eukprot:KAF5835914.1 hypothetical protein DUNSADRAFT_6672 [Dunaliella salina]
MAEESEMLDYGHGGDGQDMHDDLGEDQPRYGMRDHHHYQGEEHDDGDVLSQPPHGTEVFVSRIPREATDKQVRAFCETAGDVFDVRMPRNPDSPSQNKGFAFCVYATKEGADEALMTLNQQELPDFPGRRLVIVKSEVKNKLFIGNLPRNISKDALLMLLEEQVKGVLGLELMVDKETGMSRGFGFLEFYNNAAADAARKYMLRPDFRIHDREITVTWAEPKKQDPFQEQVKSIYVGNLPDIVDEHKLKDLFSAYGHITHVTLLRQPDDPNKLRGYAFVHFTERPMALRVLTDAESGKEFEMDGKQLMINMARPQIPRELYQQGYHHNWHHGGSGGGDFNDGFSGFGGRGGGYGGNFSRWVAVVHVGCGS